MSQENDADESESRAERLTDRRASSRERTHPDSGQAGQTGQTGQSGHSGKDEAAEWSQAGDENVKRENVALYMYLDPRLHDAVADVFEDVKYHYRKAYDVELQKNRHVYPLILEYGIETVGEMAESPTEVREALAANPYTPDVSEGGGQESETEYVT